MDQAEGKGATPAQKEATEPKASAPAIPVATLVSPPLTYSQKVLATVGMSAAAVLLILFIYMTAHIIVLCFAGLLLAVFLSAPSDLLAKHMRMKRSYALLVVLAGLLVLGAGGIYFMGYTVYKQVQELSHTLPGALKQFEGDLTQLLPGEALDRPAPSATEEANATTSKPAASDQAAGERVIAERVTTETEPATTTATTTTTTAATEPTPRQWLVEELIQLREAVTDFLLSESFVKGAGGVVSSTFGVIGSLVVIAGVGLFFAMNPSLYAQGLVRLMPIPRRKRTALILSQVGTQLQWWFVGQICSMVSIGIVTYIGLKLLGVPMAVTLAMLAGLMNFVPNFGPIIAAAPAVVLAFAPHGDQTDLKPALAGWTILIYIAIQLMEGWVITPYFQQRAVELPPALIIVSQVVLALFFGPFGLILATPILAATIVLVRMIYVEDILGDQKEGAG